MVLTELDLRFRSLLKIDDYRGIDVSLNGLQVERSHPEVGKVAFAVDASMESFQRAAKVHADLLFVHHGLFWGKPTPLRATLYSRIRYLIDRDLALYAVHLPLDAHPELGNNAGIAKTLNLKDLEPFGEYRGVKIGFKGRLPKPASLEEIERILSGNRGSCLGKLAFGPAEISTIGIISGGDPGGVREAIDEGLDLFITGDASHSVYHECLEGGINVIFGGHYLTELWGVRAMALFVRNEWEIETTLIDIPTGY